MLILGHFENSHRYMFSNMYTAVCFQYEVSSKTHIEICSNITLGIVNRFHEMLKFQFDVLP
jgi:hypothetical protein